MGYKSWDDLCAKEFGKSRLRRRIPREERGKTLCSLRNAGLSICAISSVMGGVTKTRLELEAEDQMEKARRMAGAAEGSAEDLAVLFGETEPAQQNTSPSRKASQLKIRGSASRLNGADVGSANVRTSTVLVAVAQPGAAFARQSPSGGVLPRAWSA